MMFFMPSQNASSYISKMNYTRTASNGMITYVAVVSQTDLLSTAFGCSNSADPVNASVHTVTCFGTLSFVQKNALFANNTMDQNFTMATTKALIMYQFKFGTSYSLTTNTIINTNVMTRISDLPCSNCSCADACIVDTTLTLNYTFCASASDC
jgi:hypothetical protein